MTKVDIIKIIGDLLTKLDVERGSLLPDDPKRHVLDAIRNELDDRQRTLSRNAINEGTEIYKAATDKLNKASKDAATALDKLNNYIGALDALGRILASVDDIIKSIAGIVL